MPKPVTVITGYVLERMAQEPLLRRAELARALAEMVPHNKERADLLTMANLLEDIERNHLQLVLDFKRRNVS